MPKPTLANATKSRGRPRTVVDADTPVTVQALDRAMEILAILAEAGGLTLSDLAQRTGLSAATVYRALATLQAHEMIEVQEPGQIWYVGVGAFRIGAAFGRRNSIVERARGQMRQLQLISGETAVLAQHNAGEVLVLAQAEPDAGIRASFPPGTRGDMHAMALGKAILSYMPEAEMRAILTERGLAKATSLTITSESSLLRELARVRDRGYAMDDQESAEGVRGVAAPIFGPDGEVVGALAVIGPAFRFGLSAVNAITAQLREAADQVTLAMGGRGES